MALVMMDPEPDSVHGQYLEALARAIEEYERKTFCI